VSMRFDFDYLYIVLQPIENIFITKKTGQLWPP